MYMCTCTYAYMYVSRVCMHFSMVCIQNSANCVERNEILMEGASIEEKQNIRSLLRSILK